jgi:F-type H+-transporting ATPase subunit epsilon
MATMTVEVVSAERSLLSVEAEEVYARTLEGEIGILPGHQPALLALDIGVVRVRTGGDEEKVAVHHGFLYFRDNHLVILADIAEVASQIDRERAQSRLRELEGRRAEEETALVEASIRKQQVRLTVVGG